MTAQLTASALGLDGLERLGPPAPGFTGVAVDSREVRPGHLFVAMPGTRLDGAKFAKYAVRQGAAAVLSTPEGAETIRADHDGTLPVPVFVTGDPRAELARLAARFHPGRPCTVAAVTATNGKTSTVEFLRQIWAAGGRRAASLGTLGIRAEGAAREVGATTPEPITLHRLLGEMAEEGIDHLAMEASSHGLAQRRLDGVAPDLVALGGITRDHMDYHESHAAYVAAKLRLMGEVAAPGGTAVLDIEEAEAAHAAPLAEARGLSILRVGRGEGADLHVLGQRFLPDGQVLRLGWEGREAEAQLSLIGDFQARNVALAAGLALASGMGSDAVFAALPGLHGVPGRMEKVASRANGAPVFVDYAHTPDALATALKAIRPHVAGRLVIVFGAGGDRDTGKRPLMGKAAAEGAETVIVTDDNPRSEDPAAIRAAVMEGCPMASEIGGRAAAILAGIDALKRPEDGLLIAGKGHERGQEIGGRVLPFDDAEQARAAVAALDGVERDIGGRP